MLATLPFCYNFPGTENSIRQTLNKLISGHATCPILIEETGGEDAHFICSEEQAIEVADGVGGWTDLGVVAGQYSRELMSNSVDAIQEEPKGSIDPARVLEKAHSSTKAKGSSTACIIALTDQETPQKGAKTEKPNFPLAHDARRLAHGAPNWRTGRGTWRTGRQIDDLLLFRSRTKRRMWRTTLQPGARSAGVGARSAGLAHGTPELAPGAPFTDSASVSPKFGAPGLAPRARAIYF